MSDYNRQSRDLAIKVIATIGNMFPNSQLAKKLDNSDDQTFETMIGVWMSGLSGMSEEKVGRGIKTLMASGNTFEPSVPEFVKMCKGSQFAGHRPYKPLPAPKHSDAPASIDHYHPSIQRQLTKIGMLPKPGETKHQYAIRCKDYTMASKHAGVIGPG
jgi:hypothetical protein